MARVLTHRRVFSVAALIRWLVNIVAIIVFALLGLRFVFELLAANPGSGFVEWIYTTSFPLVRPFQGIFSVPRIEGNSVFDLTALLAMLIYGLVFYLINYALEGIEQTRENRLETHNHIDDER